ncbi:hypothetical protein KIN20_038276 [Parelaphostrongylus tenuis]|uniref:SMB domain-containing protein n=1 Tax=Parelaphostrongylus tenuis TaxID=148309 RepID=A0AAD5WMG1_PARTN|nr:hypothetical protein KIN20_038276 [Parelaphostrongylus tenuis]
MLTFFFALAFFTLAESGCYHQRMCCHGRNVTCMAIDDGTRHLPLLDPHHQHKHRHRDHHKKSKEASYFTYQTPFYEASGDGYDLVYPDVFEELNQQRIGKIVFPDVVELEGSGAEEIYNKYASVDESFDDEKTNNMPKKVRRQKKKTSSSVAPKITHLFFGYPLKLPGSSEDILRYSVLDRYLPLMVSTTPALDFYDEDDEGPQFMYLEKPPTSCYCDESCTALGDCCSDYTVVCPPQECVVSNWGDWEGCVADDGICGLGVEQRVRHVTQQPARGGTPCPPLKEMRTCFKLCTKRKSFDGSIKT